MFTSLHFGFKLPSIVGFAGPRSKVFGATCCLISFYYRAIAISIAIGLLEWPDSRSDRSIAIRTSDLQFELPPELIAQRPLARRDAARLMVLDRSTGRITHRQFKDLPEYLGPTDCLVLNRSKVVPARFSARRETGGKVSGLFVREASPGNWEVLMTGAGRLKPQERLSLERGHWELTWLRHKGRGLCEVQIAPADSAEIVLGKIGSMPLPPYIRRLSTDSELSVLDREQYQTVYAAEAGSVAAPTAGLHFTPELLCQIKTMGISIAEVILHVGLGTFQPIEAEDLAEHRMHSEWYSVPPETTAHVASARSRDARVVAVGTTAVRVLETCASTGWPNVGPEQPTGWTDILIYPPYQFIAVDALITNFHLPGSTLLALVMAFAGREIVLSAYKEAVGLGYRFFSYGDAMLIL